MPKRISKSDWDEVAQIACEIVNAGMADDEVLAASRRISMLCLLSDLRSKYGEHPSILATIADYLDNDHERKEMFMKALSIAVKLGDQDEIAEIEDSLRQLERDSQPVAGGYSPEDGRKTSA